MLIQTVTKLLRECGENFWILISLSGILALFDIVVIGLAANIVFSWLSGDPFSLESISTFFSGTEYLNILFEGDPSYFLFFLVILRLVSWVWLNIYLANVTAKVSIVVREKMYWHSMTSIAQNRSAELGLLVDRVTRRATEIANFAINGFLRASSDLVVALVILGVTLSLLSLQNFAILAVLCATMGGATQILFRRLASAGKRNNAANADLKAWVSLTLPGFREIYSAASFFAFWKPAQGFSEELAKINKTYHIISSLPKIVIETLLFGTLALIAVFVDKFTSETAFLGLLLIRALPVAVGLIRFFLNISFVEDLMRDYEGVASSFDSSKNTHNQRILLESESLKLFVTDGLFDLPTPNTRFNVNFVGRSVNTPKVLIISGSSGTGKTYSVDSFLGFGRDKNYDISQKSNEDPSTDRFEIKVCDKGRLIPLSDVKCDYCSQTPFIYGDSISDFLRLHESAWGIEQVESLLSSLGLDSIIGDLSSGISHFGHGGQALSGGQRKRLAIAKVILSGAPFAIFDEPTASVESTDELKVINTLRDYLKDRCAIIITHSDGLIREFMASGIEVAHVKIDRV